MQHGAEGDAAWAKGDAARCAAQHTMVHKSMQHGVSIKHVLRCLQHKKFAFSLKK
jgi:hypothetical protein